MAIPNNNPNSTNINSPNPLNPNNNVNNNQDSSSQNMANDPLYLASFDHPGMMLTNTPFNGGNFLGWSRTIKMALGAKLKLGFIDGSSPKPVVIDNNYQRWIMCDYMVTCWILNSMIAELSDSFLYAQSTFDLWKELDERYVQSNGPLIYHIERELSKVSQRSLNVAAYFNKLKRFWDELHSLNGVPVCSCGKMRECSCGINEKFLEIDSRSKLMQFLMKLNDEFEYVRNQILSMDPLPNINKAYYIVQQVEKQKQVTHQVNDPTTFFANFKNGHNLGSRRDNRESKSENKGEKRVCTFCNQEGNLAEQCFEKIGYPDWYKGKKGKKTRANMDNQVRTDLSSTCKRILLFRWIMKLKQLVESLIWIKSIILYGKHVQTGLSFHASIKLMIDNVGLNIKMHWVVDTGA
ncbi:hypothetical protein Tco_1576804 [Tanacetum coccineum]